MKIDFDKQLLNWNDGPFVVQIEKQDDKGNKVTENIPLTLRSVCMEALLQPSKDSMEDKIKCAEFSLRLKEPGVLNFSIEEIAFLKKKVALHWDQPMIVLRACNLLEGQDEA